MVPTQDLNWGDGFGSHMKSIVNVDFKGSSYLRPKHFLLNLCETFWCLYFESWTSIRTC